MTMRRSLGLGAALAASTVSGVIIPSTMAIGGDNLAAMAMVGVDPFVSAMKVDCKGCLYAEPAGERQFTWTEGVDNALVANATISNDMKTLRLNDVDIWLSGTWSPFAGLRASPRFPQIPSDVSLEEFSKDPQAYSTTPLRSTAYETMERKQNAVAGGVSECHGPELLCKWRAVLAQEIATFRNKIGLGKHHSRPGCKGKGGRGKGMTHHGPPAGHAHHPHGPPRPVGGQKSEDWGEEARKHHRPGHHHGHHGDGQMGWKHHGPPGSRPGHHGHHGHHHGHHGPGGFGEAFVYILLNFVVPLFCGVLIGFMLVLLAAGLAKASHILVMRWTARRGAYAAIAVEEDDDDETVFDGEDDANRKSIDIEKEAFIVSAEKEVEAPPAYVDVEEK